MVVQREIEIWERMLKAGQSHKEFYPRFSEKEYQQRYKKIREMMRSNGFECLIIYGDGGFYLVNGANVRYLSNYVDFLNSYVVFPYDGNPTVFIGLRYYIPIAGAMSVIEDIRWPEAFLDPIKVVDRIKELKLGKGKIGVVGVSAARLSSLPYDHHKTFLDGLPSATLVNATQDFESIRQVPSEEEIEWLSKGAELSDLSIEAIADASRPGVKLHEVYGAAYEPLKKGGSMALCMVGVMNDPPMLHPVMFPSNRILKRGDILHAEVSVSYGGYSGQILRMIALGDPPKSYLRVHDVAVQVYKEIQKVCKPGVKPEVIRQCGSQIIKNDGLNGAVLAHGWGMGGLAKPIIYTSRISGEDVQISKNMTLIIEPFVGTTDAEQNVFFGETNRVTESGGVSYHNLPLEFIIK